MSPTPLPTTPSVTTHNSQRDEIVLGLGLADHRENLAGPLIEGLHRRHYVVPHPLRFAQDTFGPVLVDIKPKNLTAELTVDDDFPQRLRDCGNVREQE